MTSSRSRRIVLIDELRGMAVVVMLLIHALYDIVVLAPLDPAVLANSFIATVISVFGAVFCFLAGVNSNFSRSNLVRGLRLFAIAIGISLVTWFFLPTQFIFFGVLHLLGLCMIFYSFAAKKLRRISPLLGFFVCMALFAFTFSLPQGYLGFFRVRLIALPRVLYSFSFLFPFGLPGPGFQSADYYPLFPWVFIFLAGAFIGSTLSKAVLPEWITRVRPSWLSFLGKHSLLIYILHQLALYGLFYLIFKVIL